MFKSKTSVLFKFKKPHHKESLKVLQTMESIPTSPNLVNKINNTSGIKTKGLLDTQKLFLNSSNNKTVKTKNVKLQNIIKNPLTILNSPIKKPSIISANSHIKSPKTPIAKRLTTVSYGSFNQNKSLSKFFGNSSSRKNCNNIKKRGKNEKIIYDKFSSIKTYSSYKKSNADFFVSKYNSTVSSVMQNKTRYKSPLNSEANRKVKYSLKDSILKSPKVKNPFETHFIKKNNNNIKFHNKNEVKNLYSAKCIREKKFSSPIKKNCFLSYRKLTEFNNARDKIMYKSKKRSNSNDNNLSIGSKKLYRNVLSCKQIETNLLDKIDKADDYSLPKIETCQYLKANFVDLENSIKHKDKFMKNDEFLNKLPNSETSFGIPDENKIINISTSP